MPEIPTIEPFQFIRSTAFSERVQLANKLNEVIDALNQIGTIDDLQTQIDAINSEISEIQTAIGNTDTSLAELENQVNALVSEVNTTIKQAISALESDVDGIDTRLTTAEGTISEHGTEIDGLLKEVIDGVAMTSNPHGTIQVQINHEDGTNDISAPIDLGLVEQGGIVLQSGTTDRSFKLIVTLTDGTSWQTNDFVIPEGGGTEVSVTNISIAQGTTSNMIQVKIGLSDGSTISSNDWTVVTPSEFSALGTRVTTAEGNITKNTGDISDLETRVQAIEDSPGFTLQPATATRLGGVKIGANVTVQADGTISIDLSPYALKSEIPDVSQFVTAEEVAAGYQPKGDYLTEVPVGGAAIGGVKNGGNVTIETDGTMNAEGGDGWETLTPSNLPTDFTPGDEIEITINAAIVTYNVTSWTQTLTESNIDIQAPHGSTIDTICKFVIPSGKNYPKTLLTIGRITSGLISLLSISQVYTADDWNSGSDLFTYRAFAFNGAGSISTDQTVTRSNIANWVTSIKRKKTN